MILSKKLQAEWRPRRRFRALQFDGVDDYVSLGTGLYDRIKDAHTIVITFNSPIHEFSNVYLFGNYKSWTVGNATLLFWIDDSAFYNYVLRYGLMGANGEYRNLSMLQVDHFRPVMVTGTFDGQKLKLYYNGQLVGSSLFSSVTSLSSSVDEFRINGINSSYIFAGAMYSISTYNVALSDSEIKQLNDNPFNPPRPENLVLWLAPGSIDADAGKWYDLSQYGNHGTIYGAQVVEEAVREVIVK
ncbi:MAG: hypothetical protein J7J61_06940 [Candidatus Hydrothermae bacterium]|nr:hypothetical protein [Candidatus Hydrothermae bacterium]